MDTAKQNYRVRARLEVFYTGGAVRLFNDGATLACACADEVKVDEGNNGMHYERICSFGAGCVPAILTCACIPRKLAAACGLGKRRGG